MGAILRYLVDVMSFKLLRLSLALVMLGSSMLYTLGVSAQTVDVYTTRVPVTDGGNTARVAAVREALIVTMNKATGLRDVSKKPGVADLMAQKIFVAVSLYK